MKTITNKTTRPLVVPLPRGKKLHLGPRKTGQITTEAAEHGPLKKLVEAGDVEVADEQPAAGGASGGRLKGHGGGGHAHGGAMRRSGDR